MSSKHRKCIENMVYEISQKGLQKKEILLTTAYCEQYFVKVNE